MMKEIEPTRPSQRKWLGCRPLASRTLSLPGLRDDLAAGGTSPRLIHAHLESTVPAAIKRNAVMLGRKK